MRVRMGINGVYKGLCKALIGLRTQRSGSETTCRNSSELQSVHTVPDGKTINTNNSQFACKGDMLVKFYRHFNFYLNFLPKNVTVINPEPSMQILEVRYLNTTITRTILNATQKNRACKKFFQNLLTSNFSLTTKTHHIHVFAISVCSVKDVKVVLQLKV